METIQILTAISDTDLLDLLSEKTDLYIKLMSEASSTEDIQASRQEVDAIINEINKRRSGQNNSEEHSFM